MSDRDSDGETCELEEAAPVAAQGWLSIVDRRAAPRALAEYAELRIVKADSGSKKKKKSGSKEKEPKKKEKAADTADDVQTVVVRDESREQLTDAGAALRAELETARFYARAVLGSLLLFENDKTTQPVAVLELESGTDVRVDAPALEARLATTSKDRDLFYVSDSAAPTETGAQLYVQLVRNDAVVADLLVPAGFGWPDVLSAACELDSGVAAFDADAKSAATERGGTRRWGFRAKRAFVSKVVASSAAKSALPVQTTEVLDAFRQLLSHAIKVTPSCSVNVKVVERDLLKVMVKWYFFVSSGAIVLDDVVSVDNLLRIAVQKLSAVHGDGSVPDGCELPADVAAARATEDRELVAGKLSADEVESALAEIVESFGEGLKRARSLLKPHITDKSLARIATLEKVFTDRDLVKVAATSGDVYLERDMLIKKLEANWLSRDTRQDVQSWQKKQKGSAKNNKAAPAANN